METGVKRRPDTATYACRQTTNTCLQLVFFVSINSGCISPLGMESGAISNAQITASSQHDGNTQARQGRLNYVPRGWTAGHDGDHLKQWLQVDLGSYTTVTRVATQGHSRSYGPIRGWVTRYRLQYSDEGIFFNFYKEPRDTSFKVYPSFQSYFQFLKTYTSYT